MKDQYRKWVFVGLEVLLFALLFYTLYSMLGRERLFILTGVYFLWPLIPFNIMMLLILVINGAWLLSIIKSSFIKNPYLKTATTSLMLMISLIIVHCYICLYAYSGMR